MYAHIKYSNKNVKSNYQRFGVTFRDIEQEFDIIKDFKCDQHEFVSYDKAGKKKYWKDGIKRAKFVLAQLLVDPNLEVNIQKGADETSKKNIAEVLEAAKRIRGRELLTERLPESKSKDQQTRDRIAELERKIQELTRGK